MTDTSSPITVGVATVMGIASGIVALAFKPVLYPATRAIYHAAQRYSALEGPHNPAETSDIWGTLMLTGIALTAQVAVCMLGAFLLTVWIERTFPRLKPIFDRVILK